MVRSAGRSLFCSLLILLPTLFAQSELATVAGRITDQTGGVIAGAEVEIKNVETNVSISRPTNGEGLYTIPSLHPGHYVISVRKQGFKTVTLRELDLNVQDNIVRNFTIEVGSESESITVTADAAAINTTDATVSTVVDRQFVENIPLNGRSFQSLILLSPGVIPTKASFAEQGQFSVNGQRADANYYTVDGVSANVAINAGGGTGQAGAGQLPALAATGGFNNLVSVDALQEFRIQTSTYAPEFGRTPGGQISIVTRSGTNDFHGTLFEYFRNDVLDATDWFANQKRQPKARERQNDFGGVLGGPVWIPRLYNGRNRTFFFFSYEGLRLRVPLTAITSVPSVNLRQTVPANVQPLLNAFPIPNGADFGNGLAQFSASYSDPSTLDATSIRVDQVVNQKLTLFGRFNYSPSNTTPRNSSGELSNPRPTSFDTRTATAGATWVLSPTISNEVRFNWSRQFGGTSVILDNFGGAVPITDSVLPPFANRQNTFFSVSSVGARYSYGRNGEGTQGQFNFVDSFSMTRGSHTFRFGVDYRYLFPSAYSRAYDLSYTFTSAADARIGRATVSTAGRTPQFDYAYSNFSAYAQDTWKISTRLTLTYGLRYEIDPPPHGRNGKVIYAANQIDNLATLAFAPAGTPLWSTTHNNVAPRIGAAYRLDDKGATVVRGGFGVFYDLPAGAISNVAILSPTVIAAPSIIATYPADPATIPIPALSTTGPFSNVMVADPHLELPYTLQWNVALEHSIGPRQSVSASYIGAAGRRLLRQDRIFNASPTYPLVQINRNTATSDYHALQLQYQRHLSHGLQALASYTWSHSIDTASNDSASLPGAGRINIDQERGPSDFDVRHSVSGALTYAIPTGSASGFVKALLRQWSVDSIVVARSATPVDVVVQRDLGFGTFNFRPDLAGGIPLYLNDPNVAGGQRFNNTVAASNPRQIGPFLIGADLRQGTLSRNTMRGFAIGQLNFAVRRQINFTEHSNVQVKAEFFNIFNHPNFADPSGSLGSLSSAGVFASAGPNFGQSLSMLNQSLGTGGQIGGFNPLYQLGGPRSIQLSMKFAF